MGRLEWLLYELGGLGPEAELGLVIGEEEVWLKLLELSVIDLRIERRLALMQSVPPPDHEYQLVLLFALSAAQYALRHVPVFESALLAYHAFFAHFTHTARSQILSL